MPTASAARTAALQQRRGPERAAAFTAFGVALSATANTRRAALHAGRPMQVQGLARLQLQVAVLDRIVEQRGQRGIERRVDRLTDHHEQRARRASRPASAPGRSDLVSEVHNRRSVNKPAMLFDSSLRRELARSFGATLVVILTIVLTIMLIRTLGQAAVGRIAPQDVVLLLGYIALGTCRPMLALSLFIAVVATLGRMYRDSEMAIWFASGVGLTRFVRPVLRVSLAGAAAWSRCWRCSSGPGSTSAASSCASASSADPTSRASRRASSRRSSDGRRVFFIERDTQDEQRRPQCLHPVRRSGTRNR